MKILIVEDEFELAESIESYFKQEGYVCEHAPNLKIAIEKVSVYEYDCIILDINLPEGSGLSALEALGNKKESTGTLILSANQLLDDRIDGLNRGADDYLTKPFHLAELNARVKSIIRRKQHKGSNEININEIKINLDSKQVFINEEEVRLTKKEYELLLFFISNKNRVLTKNSICEYIYGDFIDQLDSFDFIYSHIKNLRKKLISAGCEDYLNTIYGVGYNFKISS